MIRKELWFEVINPEIQNGIYKDGVIEYFEIADNTLRVCMFYESKAENCKGTGLHSPYNINLYELADKCKDWALLNYFEIYSKRTKYKGVAKIKKYIDGSKRKKLICCKIANTEIEAIFDVCQWILDNKKDQICG